jgi:hypothetical protein
VLLLFREIFPIKIQHRAPEHLTTFGLGGNNVSHQMHIPASEKAAFRSVRAELIIEFCSAGAHSAEGEQQHGRSDKSNNKESLSLSLATRIDFSCASTF